MSLKSAVRPRFDLGLLVLRLGAGLSLLLLFGIPKLKDAIGYLHSGQWQFVDFSRKVGLPFPVLIAFYQSLNESFGALLVACGYWSRLAAASLTMGFLAATLCSLKVGESAWLMAAYFAVMFATLTLTGPGRFSLDEALASRRHK